MRMPDLFSEFTIGTMTSRNRLMMSPMSQNSATADGEATPWHMVHYGSRAVGGCGIVLMEDTAVSKEGRVSSKSLCLYNEGHVKSLRPIIQFCQENGAKVGIQLAHAGRKAWRDLRFDNVGRVSVDENAFSEEWGAPRALTVAEIEGIVKDFTHSAHLAIEAGFDFIEIHAAHGYLIHQFLSPITNKREDVYGSTPDGRSRFLLEVAKAVREAWPSEKPLFCRLPAHDGDEDGISEKDIVSLASTLKTIGVDLIDVAAGNVDPRCAVVTASDMQRVSSMIRQESGLPTTTVGAKNASHAKDLIEDGVMDLIAVGRPLLTNPYWLLATANGEQLIRHWPNQYKLAMPKIA